MIRKFGFTNKAVAFILVVSLPIAVFAGCQNKNSTAKAASNQTANSDNNGSNSQSGGVQNSDQFKQRMQDNIKSLVDDKTITQDQADKIVDALTQNMQGFGGKNRQRDNQNNNQNNNENKQNNQSKQGA